MDARVTRDPVDRELRRRQLAQRLVAHGARTRTISLLTGLSRHQLATLRQRWCVDQDIRHRGPAPTSFAAFRSTLRVREEAAALAVLWKCARRSAGNSRSHKKLTALELGERLCEAFEIYCACLQKREFEFEHLALLARGLEEGDAIVLANCGTCEAVILLDLFETRRHRCFHCQGLADAGASDEIGARERSECPPEGELGMVQQKLF